MRKVICFLLLMLVVSPIARASCSFYSGVSGEVPGYLGADAMGDAQWLWQWRLQYQPRWCRFTSECSTNGQSTAL